MGSVNRMEAGEDRKLDLITGWLAGLFKEAGQEENFSAIDGRLRLPELASDYQVNYDASHALRRLTEGDHGMGTQEEAHALLHDLNRWTSARRNALHEEEVTRLHHQALANGARLLIVGNESTTELLDKMANGDRLVEGAIQVVNSEIWGTIDLTRVTGSAILGYADREWREQIGWPSATEVIQMDRTAGKQKIGSGRRASSGGRQKRFHPGAPALRRPSFRQRFSLPLHRSAAFSRSPFTASAPRR